MQSIKRAWTVDARCSKRMLLRVGSLIPVEPASRAAAIPPPLIIVFPSSAATCTRIGIAWSMPPGFRNRITLRRRTMAAKCGHVFSQRELGVAALTRPKDGGIHLQD